MVHSWFNSYKPLLFHIGCSCFNKSYIIDEFPADTLLVTINISTAVKLLHPVFSNFIAIRSNHVLGSF